jgi:hypothetical protein
LTAYNLVEYSEGIVSYKGAIMAQEITNINAADAVLNDEAISSSVQISEKIQEPKETKKPAQAGKYIASIYNGPAPSLPPDFASAILDLEKKLDMRVFLLIQNAGDKFTLLDDVLVDTFLKSLNELSNKKPVAILIDSPGGFANCAYKIAMIFNKECGGFTAIVPRYAKSAATLLALGSAKILLAKHAELGPLDAQFDDPDREEHLSALDEVQALERLRAFSLETADRAMFLLYPRTRKKIETLLPMSLDFATNMVRPLFENIDVVHYTQMSRILKVAEEYAIRLLQSRYTEERARHIAHHLVENYPEHGFVIDVTEATRIDPDLVTALPVESQHIIDKVFPHLTKLTAIGYLKEVPNA